MNGRCLRLQCEVDGSARKETIEPGGSSKHYMSAFGGKADIFRFSIGDLAAPMPTGTAADRQATVGPRFEYIYVKSV